MEALVHGIDDSVGKSDIFRLEREFGLRTVARQ